jgi:hypothetical protein
MKEALRYLNNAKEILRNTRIEEDVYTDVKPVREALGTAYLAILEAINEGLVEKRGYTKKDLPKSVDEYRKVLKKYYAVHNGKLMREFESLYDLLHIAGYYRGLIYRATVVKDAIKDSKQFIEKING